MANTAPHPQPEQESEQAVLIRGMAEMYAGFAMLAEEHLPAFQKFVADILPVLETSAMKLREFLEKPEVQEMIKVMQRTHFNPELLEPRYVLGAASIPNDVSKPELRIKPKYGFPIIPK
jgi:hypothetical protein